MCWCVSFNHTTSSLASWQHVSHFIVLLSVAVAVCHLHVYVTSSQTIFLPLPQSSLHAALLLMLPLRLRPVTVVHCSHSLLLLLLLLELLELLSLRQLAIYCSQMHKWRSAASSSVKKYQSSDTASVLSMNSWNRIRKFRLDCVAKCVTLWVGVCVCVATMCERCTGKDMTVALTWTCELDDIFAFRFYPNH